MRRSALALLFALALLAGCGGAKEGSPTESSTAKEQAPGQGQVQDGSAKQPPVTDKKGSEEAAQGQAATEGSTARPEIPLGEPQPGSKAPAPGVPTTKGGDNSIQSFGTEGEEDPREGAVSNLLAYLDARLSGEFAKACSLASEEFREQLAQLIANAKAKGDAEKPKGCAETLALFTPEKAKAALREKNQVNEVLSFRVRDDGYAYLIFKGAEGKTMFIAMAEEDGQWRVNVMEAEAFSPAVAG